MQGSIHLVNESDSVAVTQTTNGYPDKKVHEAYMGHTWGQQDPGGSHVGPMILVIWVPTQE